MSRLQNSVDTPYAVEFDHGKLRSNSAGPPSSTMPASGKDHLERLLSADPYSAAIAFVQGEFVISRDLIAAVRELRNRMHPSLLRSFWNTASRLAPALLETYFQSRNRAARNIRFHYDQSNDFYRKFLDSRLVYSSALFQEPDWSLERAIRKAGFDLP
jgi:cyclopropane-fatty-acyl-phospholipid synthase